MSTYVYMKILESAPQRYDAGIRLLSLGGVDSMYAEVAEAAVPDTTVRPARVLDIGCGTGNLTEALVARGAQVTAVDQSAEMLEVAREKAAGLDQPVQFEEMAAVEIGDRFPPATFDAVASTLALSEMSPDERLYVLRAAHGVLRDGGCIVVADEERPKSAAARLARAILRFPVAALTYLLTQTSTTAVPDLAALLRASGFVVQREEHLSRAGVGLVVARKNEEGATT